MNNIDAMKRLSELQPTDFRSFPVWEYLSDKDLADPRLIPVMERPVQALCNRIVGTRVSLCNGESWWAILGNIHVTNKRVTEQFLTLSIEWKGNWFDLARYHDVDYQRRGPGELARFLAKPIMEVFPIAYDISANVIGALDVVKGSIYASPKEILGQRELVELALE